jgi:hypothetical protein
MMTLAAFARGYREVHLADAPASAELRGRSVRRRRHNRQPAQIQL